MGASGLAAVLHAAALLLRLSEDWDWFVPLSTSDYPLWTQDDILYAFSSLPRDLNFVGFTNQRRNISQIVVDPSLYLTEKTPIFYAEETRPKPDAFHVFGGSQWMILSRGFLDHIVNGLDNLPRKLLMYFNNVVFPLESYFHTVLCNTPEFHNTTVNHNLRYVIQNVSINNAISEEAIFAGPFREDDPKMQEIDKEFLNRDLDRAVPGKWCVETELMNETARISEDFCPVWGDIDVLEDGDRGIKLQKSLSRIVEEKRSVSSLCKSRFMQSERKR
ncbi:hypothetical protein CDL12_03384 [Handroanthus impetiginosus]|uniref:Protein xylosyltransferase n=1 Tax=Handroanthus impetiginosus TaxID=429701 RepID=A0A2G9I292_9LAMI|nr:hypothetical protein CDL12_03384 [Handroanthus impetiginosus]